MSTGVTVRAVVRDPALLGDVAPGARVTFTYDKPAFGDAVLVDLARADDPALVHDHTPRHGGVVAMVGMRHVEAKAEPDGALRVWLSDFYRRPLPVAGARGSATTPAGRVVPLAPADDALAGRGLPVDGARVPVRVTLDLDDGPLTADFVLPVAPDASGVASVAQTRCAPSGTEGGPRCTIATHAAVSALAISPDGTTLVVAVAGGGVSVWRLPDGTLLGGIDPAPPIAVPRGERPHPEVVNALAFRPDGTEVAVVLEGRVLRYALPSGRLVRVLSGPGYVVRDVAWWPDGSRIVVTAFHQPEATAIDVDTGKPSARYEVKLEGSTALVEPDAATVLVGSEAGTVTRFRARDGKPLGDFAVSTQAIVSLARVDDAVAALAMDGTVRALDATDGRLRASVAVGPTPTRLAAGLRGLVAVGLPGGRTVVVDPRAGTIVRTLAGDGDAQILAVAWRGPALATGDAAGRVAIWDVE